MLVESDQENNSRLVLDTEHMRSDIPRHISVYKCIVYLCFGKFPESWQREECLVETYSPVLVCFGSPSGRGTGAEFVV